VLDREDIVAVARAVKEVLKDFKDRISVLERQASAGIQSVTVRNHDKDRRKFVHVLTLADGRELKSEFKLTGLMLYEQIYQSGRQYEMGDVVTNDGSMWVALKDTNGAPGKSADWRLAVKRGQDGKSVK